LSLFIYGCNNNEKNKLSKYAIDDKYVHFETANELLDNISELTYLSELRNGGYVVIIPTDTKVSNSDANTITQGFYAQQTVAVHILNFNSKSDYKKTDKLSIENASIVCIIESENNPLTKWKHINKLRESIEISRKNGGIITAVGDISKILDK